MISDGKKKQTDVLSLSSSFIQEPKVKIGKLRRNATTSRHNLSLLSEPSSILLFSPDNKNQENLIEIQDSFDVLEYENEKENVKNQNSVIELDDSDFVIKKTSKKILLSDSDFDSDSNSDSNSDSHIKENHFEEDDVEEIISNIENNNISIINQKNLDLNMDFSTLMRLESPFNDSDLPSDPPQDLPYCIRQRLFPHQVKGLNWLLEKHCNNKGAVLADDMGLGKTFQVISLLTLLCLREEIKNVLIIAPVSVVPTWERELTTYLANTLTLFSTEENINSSQKSIKFRDPISYGSTYLKKERQAFIHVFNSDVNKKKRNDILENMFSEEDINKNKLNYNFIIVSPQLVSTNKNMFENRKFDYIILDEGHMLKNFKTKLASSLFSLKSNHRLLLTGTPIQNNLDELFTIMQWVSVPTDDGENILQNFTSRKNNSKLESNLDYSDLMKIKKFELFFPDYSIFKTFISSPISRAQQPSASKKIKEQAQKSMELLIIRMRPFFLQRKKEQVFNFINNTNESQNIIDNVSKKNNIETEKNGLYFPKKLELTLWVTLSSLQEKLYLNMSNLWKEDQEFLKSLKKEINGVLYQLTVRDPQKYSFSIDDDVNTIFKKIYNMLEGNNNSSNLEIKIFGLIESYFKESKKITSNVALLTSLRSIVRHPLLCPKFVGISNSKSNNNNNNDDDDDLEQLSQSMINMSIEKEDPNSLDSLLEENEFGLNNEDYKNAFANIKSFGIKGVCQLLKSSSKLELLVKMVLRILYLDFDSAIHFPNLHTQCNVKDQDNDLINSFLTFDSNFSIDSNNYKFPSPELNSTHRILIFSQSRLMLDIIEYILDFFSICMLRIDGLTKSKDRQKIIDDFNEGKLLNGRITQVCLLTTKACNTGITLTGADRVIIFDPSWNPAEDSQAIDRAYRIGSEKYLDARNNTTQLYNDDKLFYLYEVLKMSQIDTNLLKTENPSIIVYRLITLGSIEESVYQRQVFKEGLKNASEEGKLSLKTYFNKNGALEDILNINSSIYRSVENIDEIKDLNIFKTLPYNPSLLYYDNLIEFMLNPSSFNSNQNDINHPLLYSCTRHDSLYTKKDSKTIKNSQNKDIVKLSSKKVTNLSFVDDKSDSKDDLSLFFSPNKKKRKTIKKSNSDGNFKNEFLIDLITPISSPNKMNSSNNDDEELIIHEEIPVDDSNKENLNNTSITIAKEHTPISNKKEIIQIDKSIDQFTSLYEDNDISGFTVKKAPTPEGITFTESDKSTTQLKNSSINEQNNLFSEKYNNGLCNQLFPDSFSMNELTNKIQETVKNEELFKSPPQKMCETFFQAEDQRIDMTPITSNKMYAPITPENINKEGKLVVLEGINLASKFVEETFTQNQNNKPSIAQYNLNEDSLVYDPIYIIKDTSLVDLIQDTTYNEDTTMNQNAEIEDITNVQDDKTMSISQTNTLTNTLVDSTLVDSDSFQSNLFISQLMPLGKIIEKKINSDNGNQKHWFNINNETQMGGNQSNNNNIIASPLNTNSNNNSQTTRASESNSPFCVNEMFSPITNQLPLNSSNNSYKLPETPFNSKSKRNYPSVSPFHLISSYSSNIHFLSPDKNRVNCFTSPGIFSPSKKNYFNSTPDKSMSIALTPIPLDKLPKTPLDNKCNIHEIHQDDHEHENLLNGVTNVKYKNYNKDRDSFFHNDWSKEDEENLTRTEKSLSTMSL